MIPVEIKTLVAEDFVIINNFITQQIYSSNVPLIKEVCHYIDRNGGKRVRPLLAILCAKALSKDTIHYHQFASVVEIIHMATLLHDDVIDNSMQRHGQPTVNIRWNNPTAVLCGDYLFSKAVSLMAQLDHSRAMKILATAVTCITEGELMQLEQVGNINLVELDYSSIIYKKTAKLFEVACQIPAILIEETTTVEQSLTSYGCHLGIAFQLIDDVLDYFGNYKLLGKKIGNDFKTGRLTLPLIYAIATSNDEDSQFIRETIVNSDLKKFPLILEIIKRCGALDYVMKKAQQEIELALQALSILPNSPYKDALSTICSVLVKRCM